MIKIPEDLEAQFADGTLRSPEASLIRYKALQTVLSTLALVARPTFVLVCSGTKQLKLQHSQHIATAPTGAVVAIRSGIHVMSEFHGQGERYQSLILSVDRTFLRDAIGIPEVADDGPSVVVSLPSTHARRLFQGLPGALTPMLPDIERQFKLRELLVALMGDGAVRRLMYREAADWGNSDKERIKSVVATHSLSPLQVPDFARLCAMSLSSFKRRFHNIYGTSPGRWLSKVRLEHARTMIRNSDLPVSDICRAVGYEDVSSFIRAFRHHFGITPSALRRGGRGPDRTV